MSRLLALIHTVRPLILEFDRLCKELLPAVGVTHILDEPLLSRIRLRGRLDPEDDERLRQHVAIAVGAGADAVLVTCSTVSPCVDAVRPGAAVPVLKIDEAMVEEAVRVAGRVGVVATTTTTLEPTRRMLAESAGRRGRQLELELVHVDRALDALLRGDGQTHDALVRTAVLEIAPRVDAVVLAQASMARVKPALAEDGLSVPVLSSPHLALESVRALLCGS